MQNVTYWGWAIKGMGGSLSILEMLAKEECEIAEPHLRELEEVQFRLYQLVGRLATSVRVSVTYPLAVQPSYLPDKAEGKSQTPSAKSTTSQSVSGKSTPD